MSRDILITNIFMNIEVFLWYMCCMNPIDAWVCYCDMAIINFFLFLFFCFFRLVYNLEIEELRDDGVYEYYLPKPMEMKDVFFAVKCYQIARVVVILFAIFDMTFYNTNLSGPIELASRRWYLDDHNFRGVTYDYYRSVMHFRRWVYWVCIERCPERFTKWW